MILLVAKHLHEPRLNEKIELLQTRLGIPLHLAYLIQDHRDSLLLGERREGDLDLCYNGL